MSWTFSVRFSLKIQERCTIELRSASCAIKAGFSLPKREKFQSRRWIFVGTSKTWSLMVFRLFFHRNSIDRNSKMIFDKLERTIEIRLFSFFTSFHVIVEQKRKNGATSSKWVPIRSTWLSFHFSFSRWCCLLADRKRVVSIYVAFFSRLH